MAGYERYEADPYSEGGGGGGGGGGGSLYNRDLLMPNCQHLHEDGNTGAVADWDSGHPQRGLRDYKDKYHDQDRERDRSSYRDKYRGQDCERDRDSYHKDERDRGREKRERSDKDYPRRRERSRERSRGHERHSNEHDYGRERRHRHRSRSRSIGRSRGRSRSRSPSQERRSKRASGFDMAPPGTFVSGVSMPGQIAGLTQAISGILPGIFPFAGAQLGVMPMQAVTQQATRHARKVYVGGLPPLVNEQQIASFFSQVMAVIGGNTAGPGDAVVNVYINHEKKFAFVEMRTVEEASNAMSLDGILFEGMPVRVRRPSDYNPSLAATLGPSQPSPHLNLAAVGLIPGVSGGAEQDRVFVGGLPYYLAEAQIKELLESFGHLRRFDLVKDRETGNSKGYAFCFYQDPAVTDIACAALNGLKMGEKTLTVRRATASSQPKMDQSGVLEQAQQHIALQKIALQASTGAFLPGFSMGLTTMGQSGTGFMEQTTRIICLKEVVSLDELKNDDDFEEIYDDMKEECGKYGSILNLVIPRPHPNGDLVPGLGKVYVEYSDEEGAVKAKAALNGRKFGGNVVVAMHYSEDKFSRGEFDG